MSRDEVKQILARIDVSYPNWKPKDLSLVVDVWYESLCQYDYKEVCLAVRSFVETDVTGFAPSIGQIIGMIQNIRERANGEQLNEMQAWALVSKALRNGTYNAESEFNKLPKLVQNAVGSPNNLHNWATSDYQTIDTVVMSNFQRAYRSVVASERELKMMPSEVRLLIQNTAKQLMIEKGD